MKELRIDMRKPEEANPAEGIRCAQLCFRINHTMPYTEEYDKLINELFLGNIGENSRIMPPVNVVRGNKVKIGRNVVIMNNSLFMAAGGITIDDDVMVAANAQLISNNHDLYDHQVLTCSFETELLDRCRSNDSARCHRRGKCSCRRRSGGDQKCRTQYGCRRKSCKNHQAAFR